MNNRFGNTGYVGLFILLISMIILMFVFSHSYFRELNKTMSPDKEEIPLLDAIDQAKGAKVLIENKYR